MGIILVGIDEVGRGAWAGPVCAAAVILNQTIPGLNDSKVLSASTRIKLASIIEATARSCALGWATAKDVDSFGLTRAVRMAMEQALDGITTHYDQVLIDGPYNFLKDTENVTTMVAADKLVPAVSAASIIAKVARDRYMSGLSARFPAYGFQNNVGYGTKQHQAALQTYGPTNVHRLSYKPLRNMEILAL